MGVGTIMDTENIPEACPGTESDKAGAASACAGCPNQAICASGETKGPDPAIAEITDRLCIVKNKVLVLSGKGGVGKSTFSTTLAFALAASDDQVGLLDIDLCGPSLPRMLGLQGEEVHQSSLGWEPIYVQDNLGVMSIGFLMPNKDEAVVWRGPRKNGLIKQFLRDVHWGEKLDYLVVDTPPGTSDEHLSITTYLKETGISGAVIVSAPTEVAVLDARKELSFCKKMDIPVLGIVENMSGFVCPNCQGESEIFPSKAQAVQKMATDFNVSYLGRVPLDPRLADCCERGVSFVEEHADSATTKALHVVIEKLKSRLLDHEKLN